LTEVRGLDRPRINSVALAYKIMKTNDDLPLARICQDIDNALYLTLGIVSSISGIVQHMVIGEIYQVMLIFTD